MSDLWGRTARMQADRPPNGRGRPTHLLAGCANDRAREKGEGRAPTERPPNRVERGDGHRARARHRVERLPRFGHELGLERLEPAEVVEATSVRAEPEEECVDP